MIFFGSFQWEKPAKLMKTLNVKPRPVCLVSVVGNLFFDGNQILNGRSCIHSLMCLFELPFLHGAHYFDNLI